MGTAASFQYFGPELALGAALLLVIFVDLATKGGERREEWPATIAMVAAATTIVMSVGLPLFGWTGLSETVRPTWLFDRMLVLDRFAIFFKVLLGLSLLAVVTMSIASREILESGNQGEYYTMLLGSTLGMFLMASAANLLMAYLALEFVSLSAYVLTGFLRHDRRASEAALKYLIYGGVASGAMIFGMSWVYGLAGSMDYGQIAAALGKLGPESRLALFIGLVLVLVGFGYKVAMVPFHMWAPDVYTGAPLPVTTFLAVASKAAGFAMLLRFFDFGVGASGPTASLGGLPLVQLMAALSAFTMLIGNLAAISQTNVKRLLAYSSIAHAGYALMGVAVFASAGVASVLLYLSVYYVMNLGAFWVALMVVNSTGREDLDAFRGLAWRGGAGVAVTLAIFLFSLAGLPPFAGFIGKLYVFAAGIQGELYWLVVWGALNSVVSLYYYARIVKLMFLDAPGPQDAAVRFPRADLGAVALLSVLTIYLGIRFEWLYQAASAASRIFRG
ncbi:MAG TPA: NADH-quinone oxidoreductase subunit N [Candidatus Limnocylindria bacterium]|nr:NADH-quinone oxidoreductase subunit N [Candidatus Limnocylindria bacterium]